MRSTFLWSARLPRLADYPWTNFGSNTIGRANLNGTGVNESFITGANMMYMTS